MISVYINLFFHYTVSYLQPGVGVALMSILNLITWYIFEFEHRMNQPNFVRDCWWIYDTHPSYG